jgi:Raf kinase inhibitor-like YbhB/YbcL family protein
MRRLLALCGITSLHACGGGGSSAVPDEAPTMTLSSSAFAAGAELPVAYTCEGEDVSPPLAWSGAPPATKSFALVVHDPDAPDPAKPQRIWVHWIMIDISPSITQLAEGASTSLPTGARAGKNDWRRIAWGGACPPIGRHRYVFSIYALDTMLPDLRAPTRAELLEAIEGHVLAKGELIGTYQKRSR